MLPPDFLAIRKFHNSRNLNDQILIKTVIEKTITKSKIEKKTITKSATAQKYF